MKELLFLLCQYPFDITNRGRLRELLSEVNDWKPLVKLINAHGIIALASYNIKIAELENLVPKDSLAILENGRMQSMIRNSWLTERWKEVNIILTNAGINHILLKGMALEHTIYGSSGLRQMNDNDIYIHPDKAIKAWELLKKHGYIPEPYKSPLFAKIRFKIGRHLPALYKDGYMLEIHNRLFYSEADDSNSDPFSGAEITKIGGIEALILSSEMQLKYLISHYEHHAESGDCQLRLLADINILDKNNKIGIDDRFVEQPIQSSNPEFAKAAFRATLLSVSPESRLRFITGDIFPSLRWMKTRYRCNTLKAMMHYPPRTGKLLWILQKQTIKKLIVGK